MGGGGGVKLVPLKRKNGILLAHAIVDDVDSEYVSQFVWRLGGNGYPRRCIGNGKWLSMHRDLLGLSEGDKRQGDHKNRNPLDNRRSNLRIVKFGQNQQNVGGYGKSKHRGVFRSKNKWEARAQVNGVAHYLGLFSTEEEAANAALVFRRENMPVAVT